MQEIGSIQTNRGDLDGVGFGREMLWFGKLAGPWDGFRGNVGHGEGKGKYRQKLRIVGLAFNE